MPKASTQLTAKRRIATLSADESGQTTIEYALLLAAVVLPLMVVFRMLLGILATLYEMIVFMIGLPFP